MFSKNFHPKKIIAAIIFFSAWINQQAIAQNIGINNPTPDASSLLDLTSTSQGLLVPRMTTAQRNAITAPANGLLVYDITLLQFYYYDGTQWQPIFTSSNGWGLSGNAGTNPATNFLGTTDNQPLNFRMNNQKVGMISSTDVFFGYQAGNSDNGTHNSTGIGIGALSSNTSGTSNTAIGAASLFLNTGGAGNTAIGTSVFLHNTTGNTNIGVGYFAGQENTIGSNNIAIGVNALAYNVAGSNALAIGRNAMLNANNQASAFTNSNVAVGYEALRGSTTPTANTGNSNTALGYQTLWSNSTGSYNTVNGYQALYSNTTGSGNIANGYLALRFNTTGYENTASGLGALNFNTTGSYNTAIGRGALLNNNTGNYNIATGIYALMSNTTGNNNTGSGYLAGFFNTSGSNNTFLGYGADLGSSTQRTNATAIGYNAKVDASNALVLGGTGANAVSVGIGTINPSYARLQVQGMVGNTVAYFSGAANSQGLSLISDWPGIYFNSYYQWGAKSMGSNGFPATIYTDQGSGGIVFQATNVANTYANAYISIPERMRITGAGNVGIGTSNPQTALHIGSGGTLRIDDGSGARFAQLFHSGNGNLHIDAVGGGSTYINWYGGPALYVGNGGAWYGPVFANAFYSVSSARFKKDIVNTRYGLAEILKLQAREYKYIDDKTGRNEVGLIAEDVEKIIPEVVYRSAEDNQVMGIDYGKLSPVLIEAIKEQQKIIDGLKTEMAALKSELNEVRNK